MRPRRFRKICRQPSHDYRGDGFYLLTLITRGMRRILSYVDRGVSHPSPVGELVLKEALEIESWCDAAFADTVALMPNHLHLILRMRGNSPDFYPRLARGPVANSVSMIVGQIKSRATQAAIRAKLWRRGERLWERGFHDRILPDLRAVNAARRYLELNPPRWERKYGAGRPDPAWLLRFS